jgi:hypothetical protein
VNIFPSSQNTIFGSAGRDVSAGRFRVPGKKLITKILKFKCIIGKFIGPGDYNIKPTMDT